MSTSATNAGFNLATLTADARALIEADKTACLIRWKVRDLNGPEKDRQGARPAGGCSRDCATCRCGGSEGEGE